MESLIFILEKKSEKSLKFAKTDLSKRLGSESNYA